MHVRPSHTAGVADPTSREHCASSPTSIPVDTPLRTVRSGAGCRNRLLSVFKRDVLVNTDGIVRLLQKTGGASLTAREHKIVINYDAA